jgi:hypothetical protein
MIDIKIKEQKTILQITSGNKLVTIQNIINLPASHQAIIQRFFETFEILSIEPAPITPIPLDNLIKV